MYRIQNGGHIRSRLTNVVESLMLNRRRYRGGNKPGQHSHQPLGCIHLLCTHLSQSPLNEKQEGLHCLPSRWDFICGVERVLAFWVVFEHAVAIHQFWLCGGESFRHWRKLHCFFEWKKYICLLKVKFEQLTLHDHTCRTLLIHCILELLSFGHQWRTEEFPVHLRLSDWLTFA